MAFCVLSILAFMEAEGIAEKTGESETVTLILGGDVMLSNWVMEHLDKDGLEYPFLGIQDILQRGDIRFCNLEAPIGTYADTLKSEKKYTFALPPRYRHAIKYGDFDIVSLANNHILDYSSHLADSTVHYLDELGIKQVGYGHNSYEAPGPVILERKGIRIGFLAYSMTFPREFWASPSSPGTAYPDAVNFGHLVQNIEDEVDFTVVSFHWGAENSDSTKQYQQDFARKAVDMGADLIVGHHPHIWQGVEDYKDRLIAYSVGNLCFGSFSPTALQSGLLEVEIGPDTIHAAKIHPLDVDNVRVRFQPRKLDEPGTVKFFNDLRYFSSRFDSSSTTVIEDDGSIRWGVRD